MALRPCSKCGNSISDRSLRCPRCAVAMMPRPSLGGTLSATRDYRESPGGSSWLSDSAGRESVVSALVLVVAGSVLAWRVWAESRSQPKSILDQTFPSGPATTKQTVQSPSSSGSTKAAASRGQEAGTKRVVVLNDLPIHRAASHDSPIIRRLAVGEDVISFGLLSRQVPSGRTITTKSAVLDANGTPVPVPVGTPVIIVTVGEGILLVSIGTSNGEVVGRIALTALDWPPPTSETWVHIRAQSGAEGFVPYRFLSGGR